ncbi:putative membrane protein, partial [Yersinia pestis PY-66]|jgi:ribonuclease HI
MN